MNILRIVVIALLIQSAVPDQSGSAVVQGIVVLTGTNTPLSKAAVELRSTDNGLARAYTAMTEGDGAFAFRKLPAGQYQLTAIRAGYVRGDFALHGPGASGISVTLRAGQQITDIHLAMSGTGTIAGRVTDSHAEGIGNVHVKALRFAYQEGRRVLIDVKSVFTDDRGEYRLGWLPPGPYIVSALHPDSASPTAARSLNAPEITNSSTNFLSTTVTNAGGLNGGSFSGGGTADPAVRSRIGLAADEDYVPVYFPNTLDANTASVIDVRAGGEIGNVNLTIVPMRPGSVAGNVIDSGTGQGIATVSGSIAISRNPTYNYRATSSGLITGDTSFSVTGLAPGSYTITAVLPNAGDTLTGHTTVDLAEGSNARVNILLQHGVQVTGQIMIEGRWGGDIRSLRVSLRTEPVIPGISDTAAVSPFADGSLTLPGIAPGNYRVHVSPLLTLASGSLASPSFVIPGPPAPTPIAAYTADPVPAPAGAYVKSIRMGNTDVLSNGLRLDTPPDQPLVIVIGTDSGQVDGTVTDDRQRAIPFAAVALVPEMTKRTRFDLYKSAVTDLSGAFHFQNIPPGDYKLFSWEDVETGSWLDPQFMRNIEDRGKAIHIDSATKATADIFVMR